MRDPIPATEPDDPTVDIDDRSEVTDADKLTAEYPPEQPVAVDGHGTTPAEMREGLSLDERLAMEADDHPVGAAAAGAVDDGSVDDMAEEREPDRLIGEDAGTRDVEGGMVREQAPPHESDDPDADGGIREQASPRVPASAEEQAMTTTDEL